MTRMPSFPRPARRTLLAAALALVALAACCALALAQDKIGMEIEIVTPEGDERIVNTDEIKNPEINTTYTVRPKSGPPKQVTVEEGIAIVQLLRERRAELEYSTVTFPRPGGGKVTLTKDDIDSTLPPAIYWDEATSAFWFVSKVHHFKFTSASLQLEQTSSKLEIEVDASRTKIAPGESVKLTASVSGGPSNASYQFNWVFDDGKKDFDGNRSVSHTFEEEGTYDVVVGVKIEGAKRSDSGSVRIKVGDGKKSDKDRDGGGTNTTGTADSGAANGSTGAGSTNGSGSSSSPYTPPVTPPSPPPAPSTKLANPPDIATAGPTVEGNLLADASDPPATSILESAAKAARDGQRKDDDAPDGAGVPEAALSIAGVLALLGLGAGMELREGRPPRLRLPRRAA
jgi:plastocyanin